MPRIQTQTTYTVELSENERNRINQGGGVSIDLPDGNSIKVVGGDGDVSDTDSEVDGAREEDVGADDVRQLVETGQSTTPSPTGGDTEEGENPEAGDIIDIERAEEEEGG